MHTVPIPRRVHIRTDHAELGAPVFETLAGGYRTGRFSSESLNLPRVHHDSSPTDPLQPRTLDGLRRTAPSRSGREPSRPDVALVHPPDAAGSGRAGLVISRSRRHTLLLPGGRAQCLWRSRPSDGDATPAHELPQSEPHDTRPRRDLGGTTAQLVESPGRGDSDAGPSRGSPDRLTASTGDHDRLAGRPPRHRHFPDLSAGIPTGHATFETAPPPCESSGDSENPCRYDEEDVMATFFARQTSRRSAAARRHSRLVWRRN